MTELATTLPDLKAAKENQAKLPIEDSDLPLQRAYFWERERGDAVYMTQPIGGGEVVEFTWKQTLDGARRMAAHLKAKGFPAGSSIAILSKNCAHFIMTDLAIWMAGYTSVALYPTLTPDTISYILEHSESKLLFVGKLDGWDGMKPGVPDDMPCISYPLSPKNDYPTWNDIVKETDPIEGSPTRSADELAILVYTSGSTGQPKGVAHDFGNLARAQKGFAPLLKLTSEDRVMSYLPLAHVFERAAIEGCSIYNGTHVFFAESLETFVKDIQRARPTVFQSVPRLWLKFQLGVFKKMPPKKFNLFTKIPILSGIVKNKILTGLGLDQCRLAVSGSAPIPPELIAWYNALGVELLEGYAMSENFCYSHFTRPGAVRAGRVGAPMTGCDVKLSEEGEILVKSPVNMVGYYKEPEMSKDSFTEDGYLKTGDRGEIDPADQTLRVTGRTKELFKTSKGKYVAPAPIENAINSDDAIELSCVGGSGMPAPHALVQLNETLRKELSNESQTELTPKLEALLARVNGQIEPFERMQFLVVISDEWAIENGFLTPTMKLKRSVVEDTYGPKTEEWYKANQKVIWA